MNHRQCVLCLLMMFVSMPALADRPGENMALGKKYTLWPAPNYADCTDPGDATQLTDGKVTKNYFWTQLGTVGWTHVRCAAITVDLGRVEPIGGVSYHTAAGVADVSWPNAIHILTSDDGKTYRDSGDLVAMDLKRHGPWPKGYAIRQLTTSELHTRGRFVCFLVLILADQNYIFCDEVEVLRGSPELLEGAPGGTPVPSISELTTQLQIQPGVRRRFEADVAAVQKAIDTAVLAEPSARAALRTRATKAGASLRTSEVHGGATFRAVLPFNEAHAAMFQVQAALWKAQGRADLTYGVPAVWDPTDCVGLPSVGGQIEVHSMRGEYRAAAVNLANASAAPIEVQAHFEGLPGSPTPEYVVVHEVSWTDTSEGRPVAAALPLARREGAQWRLTVLPGLVRQVWLTFHVEDVPPGEYMGHMIVEGAQDEPLQVPVRLQVYPLNFPQKTTLQLGGWEYTDGSGCCGITPRNRTACLAHLQDHFVNAPWSRSAVVMPWSVAADNTVKLKTQAMDDWLAQWPNANTYYVDVQRRCCRAESGTAEFDRQVGAWISAWVRYLGTKGISPERLAMLIDDEPREVTDIGPIVAWAKAIHAAEPKVRIWEDPTYEDPARAPAALFEACDILCPNRTMWLAHAGEFAAFYRDQQRQGRTLQLYSCSGPARLLDPYSYYRLQAWNCWQIGGTGSFFWAFGDNGKASSRNEYLAAAGPYTPLFLDKTTVTAGKQMEAIREGVEDFEYFVLLGSAVEKAKTAGRSDAILSRAESLLTTAANEVLAPASGANELRWYTPKDRTKADSVRIQVLEVLSALQRS